MENAELTERDFKSFLTNFQCELSTNESLNEMSAVLGYKCPSFRTIEQWIGVKHAQKVSIENFEVGKFSNHN